MAGTLTIGGQQTGIATGTNSIQTSLTMSSVTWATQLTVASTTTQILPVTGLEGSALLIEGPPGSTVTITIKGNAGDTGISIDPVGPTLVNLPATNGPLYVTTGSGTIPAPGITCTLL